MRSSHEIWSTRFLPPASRPKNGTYAGFKKWLRSRRAASSRSRRNSSAAHKLLIGPCQSYPPGSKIGPDATNFSLYSRAASRVELLLFDHPDDANPASVIDLDAASNRSYHYWHVFVPGISAGQLYGYRVHGPWEPANGQRFDASRVLLDPYARAVPGSRTIGATRRFRSSPPTGLTARARMRPGRSLNFGTW